MPTLQIDEFNETPHVGDKVRVVGKVESIDENTGEVEVSYGDVKIMNDKKHKKHKREDDDEDEEVVFEETADMSNSESLDNALARSFPNTQ